MSVMTFAKIAMRNLFSKPVTTKYPFEPAVYPERTRGHIEIDFDKCILCSNCARHCPTETIKVDRSTGTWSIARFDCVQCGNCVQVCPKQCLSIVPGYFAPGTEKVTESFNRPVETKGTAADAKPQADLAKCKFCTLCAKKCPQGAITVDRAAKTWTLNAEECVSCGLCKENCHFDAISMAAGGAEAAPADAKPQADLSKCKFCTLCAKKCPQGAITVDRAAKSWTLNAEECISCGLCKENCHFDAISMK